MSLKEFTQISGVLLWAQDTGTVEAEGRGTVEAEGTGTGG